MNDHLRGLPEPQYVGDGAYWWDNLGVIVSLIVEDGLYYAARSDMAGNISRTGGCLSSEWGELPIDCQTKGWIREVDARRRWAEKVLQMRQLPSLARMAEIRWRMA